MPAKHIIPIIGPAKSGRTQVYNRLVGKKKFEAKPKPVPGTQIGSKKYPEQDIEIQFWDFGPDIGVEQINATLKRASKICVVFDASDPQWLTTLERYLGQSGIALPEGVEVVLVGTKRDLPLADGVEKGAQSYARRHLKCDYWAVSAADDTNIPELSQKIATNLPISDIGTSHNATLSKASTMRRESFSKVLNRVLSDVQEGFDVDLEAIMTAAQNADQGELEDEDTQRLLSDVTSSVQKKKGAPPFRVVGEFGDTARQLDFAAQRAPTNRKTYTPMRMARFSEPAPTDSTFSFALRIAGMALILAAITSLIYLAIVAAGFVSAVALTGVVNQVVVTVGGLLGMSAPAAALTQLFATYGISTAAGSELLAAGASWVTLGVGYGLRRLGQKPAAANEEVEPVVSSRSTLSTALRLAGMALMLAALVNAIYLILIAMNVFSAVALTAGMNHLLVTVGGIVGFAAPVAAFGNACAAIGLSTTVATGALSATGSLLMAGIGYSMFKRNAPVRPVPCSADESNRHEGRDSPPLIQGQYK